VLGGVAGFTLSPLEDWHDSGIATENFNYEKYGAFDDYLVEEEKFLEQIYSALDSLSVLANKYKIGTQSSPVLANGENWNASFHLRPENQELIGGILLVHGLSDSPYHLRAIANVFKDNGYFVICLRLPGHGTVPGALIDIKWQNWSDAVEFAVNMVQKEIETVEDADFFVGGFSTGGALTLKYTLDAISSGTKRVPDKLFLFSPAIGVTNKALLADWHKLVAWLPFYEKFRWESIEPENDPFKYNSFAKNAADQIFELTLLNKLKARLLTSDQSKCEKMPPMYAFQSVVDGTVITDDLITLFKNLGTSHSELVLFDINRRYENVVKPEKNEILPNNDLNDPDFQSNLIIATNRIEETNVSKDAPVIFYKALRQSTDSPFSLEKPESMTGLSWPANAFALSHVCIPISPEDQFYGQSSKIGKIDFVNEKEVLVGEKAVLADASLEFKRIRYNPFFSVVKNRIHAVIAETNIYTGK
jgi:esterase/lipase